MFSATGAIKTLSICFRGKKVLLFVRTPVLSPLAGKDFAGSSFFLFFEFCEFSFWGFFPCERWDQPEPTRHERIRAENKLAINYMEEKHPKTKRLSYRAYRGKTEQRDWLNLYGKTDRLANALCG